MNHLRDVLARAWWVAGSRMPSAVMKCSAGWCLARIIEPVSKLDSLRVLQEAGVADDTVERDETFRATATATLASVTT